MAELNKIEFKYFNKPINENTWQQIHESIIKINQTISLITNNDISISNLSDIINSINFYDNFIVNCLSSERSKLSGVTVELLILLCNLFNKYKIIDLINIKNIQSFDIYLKTTLQVCSKVNRVLQNRGEKLLLTFAENDILFYRNYKVIIDTLNISKSKIQRLSVFKSLKKFIEISNKNKVFEKIYNLFLNIIKNGIKDISPEIRNLSKEFIINNPTEDNKIISNNNNKINNNQMASERLYARPYNQNIKKEDNKEDNKNKYIFIEKKEDIDIKKYNLKERKLDLSTDIIYQNLAESVKLFKNSPMKKITRINSNQNKLEDEIFTPKALKTFLSKYRPETNEGDKISNNSKNNIKKLSEEISKLMIEKNIQNKLNNNEVNIEKLKRNIEKNNKEDLNIINISEINEYNDLKNELKEIEAYKVNDNNNNFTNEFVCEEIERTLNQEYNNITELKNNQNVESTLSQSSVNAIFEPEIIESSSNTESELEKLVSLADEEKLKSDFEDEDIREQNLILGEYDKENTLKSLSEQYYGKTGEDKEEEIKEDKENIRKTDEVIELNYDDKNELDTEYESELSNILNKKDEKEIIKEEEKILKGDNNCIDIENNSTKNMKSKTVKKPVNKRKAKKSFDKKFKSKKTSKKSPNVEDISLILLKEKELENSQTEIKEKNNLLENRDDDTLNNLEKSILDLSIEVIKGGEEWNNNSQL